MDINGSAVNILIVDDHPENLQALKAILSAPDRNLVMAGSGRQALAELLKHEFALIMLDVMMPEIDGFELARLIKSREKTKAIPIIFLTAIATDIRHIFQGYSVGAVDYIAKPLDPQIVIAKVAVFVELYKKNKTILLQEKTLREHELAALRQTQEENYQTLIESIPQIVWLCHPNGTMEYFNSKWFLYTGLSLQESRGDGWLKAVHPEDRPSVSNTWSNHRTSGQVFEMEYRLFREQDQKYRWHLARGVPLFDKTNKISDWVGTYTDIEDQKFAEIELKKTLLARDEFFSIASHELKSPLNSLGLKLQILEHQMKKNDDELISKKQIFETIEFVMQQMFRLGTLIDNLLDISRIRLKQLRLEKSELNLVTIVREIVSRFEDQAELAGSPISVLESGTVRGEWDKIRIEQVITNLISNAIKYGNAKPIEVSVSLDQDTAVLVVQDSGLGISPADQARIFERFERASTDSSISGLGLGLYITKQIVEAHHGTIIVESKVERGSKFIVKLPQKFAEPEVNNGSQEKYKRTNPEATQLTNLSG